VRAGAVALAALLCALGAGSAEAANGLSFQSVKVQKRPGDGGLPWAEPRIAIGPDNTSWVITNREQADGQAIVLGSPDGLHWKATPALPAGQTSATPDVDILAMPSGRLLGSELDDAGINFPTAVSDDRGKTWTESSGSNKVADQDRQWFAYGPDPKTGKENVYLLFHNLASGQAQHNMFVATSTDGGKTFGVPIPVAQPPSDAYTDLQCADSGGPSAIWVNQHDGTVYAEYTTRATPSQAGDTGGCTTAATGQPFEFNIVAATRVWIAQSSDGGQTWTNSLAVDDAKSGQIVSMQVASGGLDRAGNVYVAYPEGPLGRLYPDYSGAGVRYRWAAPAKDGNLKWSPPHTLVAADKNAPGNVLVHMQAGDPGRLIAEYWRGQARKGKDPVWFMTASETTDGLGSNPHVKESRISDVPGDTGTASNLMGACHQEFSVVSGIVNGLACGRSPDVWGLTANASCRAISVWPAVDSQDNPNDNSAKPPKVAGNDPGTWVSLQTGGPSLCGKSGQRSLFPGGCPDQKIPVSSFAPTHAVALNHGRLTVKGSASDEGCISANLIPGKGRVDHVLVSVAKVRGKGKGKNCSFLKANGRLTGFKNCRRPIVHRASGSTSWKARLNFPARLPRGHYRIIARAVDVAGNREPPAHTRFALTFR
jgi:hypothetical protein